ncbi:hypothetical protein M0802_016538 [Mischocyttarus mexicanus]|nr:hypothetical protein M0802_016538 [Mischocyttarus mexicanus]
MQSLELTILSVGVTSIGWGIAHGFGSSESSESVEEGGGDSEEGLGSGGNRGVSFDISVGRSTSLSGILGGVEGDGNGVRGGSKEEACGEEESGGGGSEDGLFDVSAGRSASLSGISSEVEEVWFA